jgi:poly-gamma-glutamate synthesis protein (capsule biosynthesis protein)
MTALTSPVRPARTLSRLLAATLCGLLALAPAALAEKPVKPTKKKRMTTEQTAPAPSPKPIAFEKPCADQTTRVRVAAVGDVLLHDMFQKWAATQKEGFYASFEPVADIIRAADIAFANLEGPAAEGVASNGKAVRPPAMRYDKSVYRGYPMFNYHPSIVTDLKRAGFRVLLTANNHALDRHQLGADKTIETIKGAGLAFTGTRHRDAMTAPWYTITPVKVAGGTFNIAWLGCAYGTNGVPDKANQVLKCYDQRDEVLENIRTLAKRADVHAIFFAPHWGNEYQHKPDEKQTALAKDVLDAGATAVIGTHPHVMQPLEKYLTKDGREAVIGYSLGNFVSNQIGLPRLSSAILLLSLGPDGKGKLQMASVGWIPLRMQTNAGFRVEAIDRLKAADGRPSRIHLARVLPEGNIHPPTAPFATQLAGTCPTPRT